MKTSNGTKWSTEKHFFGCVSANILFSSVITIIAKKKKSILQNIYQGKQVTERRTKMLAVIFWGIFKCCFPQCSYQGIAKSFWKIHNMKNLAMDFKTFLQQQKQLHSL